MYGYFEMYAGYLKHLVMMKSALVYLWKIGGTANAHQKTVKEMLVAVEQIQKDVDLLQKCVQKVSNFDEDFSFFCQYNIFYLWLLTIPHYFECPNQAIH